MGLAALRRVRGCIARTLNNAGTIPQSEVLITYFATPPRPLEESGGRFFVWWDSLYRPVHGFNLGAICVEPVEIVDVVDEELRP